MVESLSTESVKVEIEYVVCGWHLQAGISHTILPGELNYFGLGRVKKDGCAVHVSRWRREHWIKLGPTRSILLENILLCDVNGTSQCF